MFHELTAAPFRLLAPTSSSSLGSTHHVEAAGRAESELAEGAKKKKKKPKEGVKRKRRL